MKKLKYLSYTVVILIVVLFGASVYMLNVSLKTQVKITDTEDAYSYIFKHQYLKTWVDSLNGRNALKDTIITASDGAKLHGLYVRSANKSARTALIIHGYTDNAIRMLMIGYLYSKRLDYNILLPDLRGQGKSVNDYIQMGWKDRLDILEWISVSKKLFGDTTQMVMHGISMGAATTMMTSGETIPENIKCFVEDCGYTSVWDEFKHKLKDEYGLPSFPLLYTTSLFCQLKLGWNFKEASALEQLKKCQLPMFFIHGDKDNYVPTSMVNKLYEAKSGEKEIWIVPGVEHANAYWDFTEEYISKTSNFVSKYL